MRPTRATLIVMAAALLVLTAPAATAGAATYSPWTAQKSGTTRTLYGVSFVTVDNGWAVGAGGVIRSTTNAGATWRGQKSGVTENLRDVVFVDASNGWIVGDRGLILHTTDGGVTWVKQTSGTTSGLLALWTDGTRGWAVGSRGTILATVNGGATWTAQRSGTWQTLNGVAFAGAANGWAGGNRGAQLRTTDGGASWTPVNLGRRQTVYGLLFVGAGNGWEVGSGGMVRHSTDGSSWTNLSSGTRSSLYDVAANAAGNVWLIGPGGLIRYSGDAGATWATQASTTKANLRAVARAGRSLYAVGDGGTIVAAVADLTPPVTTAMGLQADDHSGWTNTGVTVTLTATDPTSGVAATYFALNGGAPQTYSAPFTITTPGRTRVTYWSQDKAGNTEEAHAGWVNIDAIAPTVGDDADGQWHRTDVTVHLSPADAGGSGVAGTEYRLQGGGRWLATTGHSFVVAAPASGANDGQHVYEYRALDAAGNASTTGACTVRIDATPAKTTADGLFDKLTGWSQTARTVTLSASDVASGVAATHYTVDGGEQQLYAGPFTVGGDGRHPVTYWSVDAAGNVEAVHTGWVNIAPLYAEASGLAPDDDPHWRNTPANVSIAGGGGNAPYTVWYQLDGGDWQSVASPASFSVSGVGRHTVSYYVVDGLAQESERLTGYVNIDAAAPVTTTTPVPKGWSRTDVVVSLAASDDLSGVATTFYRIDGGDWMPGTQVTIAGLADHSMDGPHTVGYYSSDEAGNAEAVKTFVARIDTRRPVTKAPYAASVVRNRSVALRCKIEDAKPCAPKAKLRLVVKDGKGRVRWQRTYDSVRVNKVVAKRFLCKLPVGTYRFYVYAVDRAGNVQRKAASNRLTVR